MGEPLPELIQFPYSHFNEKARWALDFKGVPHRRRNLFPGPHARTIKPLTGRTLVPLVRFADADVDETSRIIDELERRQPEPALYPADPAERERALELQRWFDDEVGPKVRRALFSILIDEPGYVCRVFGEGHSGPARLVYRALLPFAAGQIREGMGLTGQAAVDDAFEATRGALDFVANEPGPEGYLVGSAFSVADLAAAALLAPACNPPAPSMELPEPRPESVRAWHARWAEHPGVAWVHRIYEQHRGATAAV